MTHIYAQRIHGATYRMTIITLILDTVYGVGAISELTILPSIVSTVEAQVRLDLEKTKSHSATQE